MFQRIWQQLVRWFRSLFGIGKSKNPTLPSIQKEPPPPLSDTDLEFLFTQLLEGVQQQRGRDWAIKWLKNIEHRVSTGQWLEWLRRFGERLVASPAANNELAARMVQLGELRIGEVGDVAGEIGMQLLTRNPGEPVWEYDGPDAEPIAPDNQQGEVQTITLDELFVTLQQDDNLRHLIAQQLGIETDDPQVIVEALINQFNAADQSTTHEAEN